MKLLLDENLPHQIRLELPDFEIFTATYMGWSGIENGELLQLAAGAGFDAMITNDRGMEYQQTPRVRRSPVNSTNYRRKARPNPADTAGGEFIREALWQAFRSANYWSNRAC